MFTSLIIQLCSPRHFLIFHLSFDFLCFSTRKVSFQLVLIKLNSKKKTWKIIIRKDFLRVFFFFFLFFKEYKKFYLFVTSRRKEFFFFFLLLIKIYEFIKECKHRNFFILFQLFFIYELFFNKCLLKV